MVQEHTLMSYNIPLQGSTQNLAAILARGTGFSVLCCERCYGIFTSSLVFDSIIIIMVIASGKKEINKLSRRGRQTPGGAQGWHEAGITALSSPWHVLSGA